VLIRVEAISAEGGDLINRASTPPLSPGYILGYAAAGEVIAVGPEAHDRLVGQRVISFDLCGSHATMRAVQASRTWLVPDGLDRAAAALPILFGTAYHSLLTRGGLGEGEAVLIRDGDGAIGLAAIQLAHQSRATLITTVSGCERAQRLAVFGLAHALNSRMRNVAEEGMRLPDGPGVNLIVDPVGSTLRSSRASLRPEGRLVFVGNTGGAALDLDLRSALQANQSLRGVFMGTESLFCSAETVLAGI